MQGTKINSKGKEVPHGVRLYSIAASRYGDTFDGKTTSLCVRRAEYWCPEMNAYDPAKKGICSNYLCDAKPGDEITMTGAFPGLCRHSLSLYSARIVGAAARMQMRASLSSMLPE
jgi:Na+-transporting NADH:ubiquinone oxidoreductase subunit NqrF